MLINILIFTGMTSCGCFLYMAALEARGFALHHPAAKDVEWLGERLGEASGEFGVEVRSRGDILIELYGPGKAAH